jgi:hypothetical protein
MSVTQMEELQEGDQTLFEERKSAQGKRNPPARNTSRFWFERFLAVIQRQNPAVIDSTFLNQIAPSNEGKLLAQLKFLHVIDEQGKPTQLLPMLNMVGEEQKKAFQEIAKGSYQDLLGEVKIDKAVPDDLINFFIRRYAFTRDKSVNASKFFLYLVEKGSLQVSPELVGFMSEKSSQAPGQNGSTQLSPQRIARTPQREARVSTPTLVSRTQQKRGAVALEQQQAVIQATISIKLDKDTPKEYWDRVFALLGERKPEVNVITESENVKAEEAQDQTES